MRSAFASTSSPALSQPLRPSLARALLLPRIANPSTAESGCPWLTSGIRRNRAPPRPAGGLRWRVNAAPHGAAAAASESPECSSSRLDASQVEAIFAEPLLVPSPAPPEAPASAHAADPLASFSPFGDTYGHAIDDDVATASVSGHTPPTGDDSGDVASAAAAATAVASEQHQLSVWKQLFDRGLDEATRTAAVANSLAGEAAAAASGVASGTATAVFSAAETAMGCECLKGDDSKTRQEKASAKWYALRNVALTENAALPISL